MIRATAKSRIMMKQALTGLQNQFASIQDPVQKSLMAEKCILVNDADQIVGSESKLDCHAVTDGKIKLHRAFSAFLFNSEGKLLMQRRSQHKVTFPHLWTNTCCSHPLFEGGETEGIDGVKRAAARRIEYELGINELGPQDFDYLTRIHYFALSDDKWGEHEIDYILFVQKDVDLNVNENEVGEVKYFTLDEVQNMNEKEFTPWFRLILETKLPIWWKSMDRLQSFRDHAVIHRL